MVGLSESSGRKRRENLAGTPKADECLLVASPPLVLDQPSCKISYDIRLDYWVSVALDDGWSVVLNGVDPENQRTLTQFTSDPSDPLQ